MGVLRNYGCFHRNMFGCCFRFQDRGFKEVLHDNDVYQERFNCGLGVVRPEWFRTP